VSLPDSAMIFGDRDRLMQLFNNLLENSLRYTDSGGGLHITASRAADAGSTSPTAPRRQR
jgi:two-component system sensor histidine kinase BaeS